MGKNKPTGTAPETVQGPSLPSGEEIHDLAKELVELSDHIDAAGVDVYATGRMKTLMRDQINPLFSAIRNAGPCAPLPKCKRINVKTGEFVEPPADSMPLWSTQRIDELPVERQKLCGLFGAIQRTIGRLRLGKCTGPEAAVDLQKQAAELQAATRGESKPGGAGTEGGSADARDTQTEPTLTDDELEVLFILADTETLTKNGVIERELRERKRQRSPSTVKKIVRCLIDKDLVQRPALRSGVRLTEAGKARVQQ
jgi:hypothetical protein